MKEIKINVPEGYEIDKENSTFECIKFKPIAEKWRDKKGIRISGYYISHLSHIHHAILENSPCNYKLFATEKQAKSALAMARISQIMDNDKRFGGVITDEEWAEGRNKYVIERGKNKIIKSLYNTAYAFLAFHTLDQRDLFLKENEDLIKDYLMLD